MKKICSILCFRIGSSVRGSGNEVRKLEFAEFVEFEERKGWLQTPPGCTGSLHRRPFEKTLPLETGRL
jgi:hypothetical protein